MASVAQPPAPLGDDPFGGAFDAAFPGETKEEDMPHGLIEEFKAQAGHRIDVLGDMAASLNIKFNDRAARKPIGNLLNERVEEGAAVRSIGWHAIRVHEYEEVPGGEREHVGMRNYKDEDGARILLEKAKYLVVAPDRPPGFKGRIYVYSPTDRELQILILKKKMKTMSFVIANLKIDQRLWLYLPFERPTHWCSKCLGHRRLLC